MRKPLVAVIIFLAGTLPLAFSTQGAAPPAPDPAWKIPEVIQFIGIKPGDKVADIIAAAPRQPRSTDSLLSTVGLGYVQGADWGLTFQSAGAIGGLQLQLESLVTHGVRGAAFDRGSILVVDPDRSWHWKDEDHLAEALEIGLFTPEQAKAMRTEGERAIERIERWSAPFDEGWENWRPDLDWPLPSIPDGWANLKN